MLKLLIAMQLPKMRVAIGKTVIKKSVRRKRSYIIVGSAGADAFAGKVSNNPIGRALIGKKTGDTATVKHQLVAMMSKILKVEQPK